MKGQLQAERPQGCAAMRKASWPQGATAGLLLVAAVCLGIATALYQVAGPRDVFAADSAHR